MLITPFDLEKESLILHESIPPAPSITRRHHPDRPLPIDGKADLIVEHRGPQEEVADIRVRASYDGRFEVSCARCLEPVSIPLAGSFDLLFRPEEADAESGERAHHRRRDRNRVLWKERLAAGGRGA